MFRPFICERIGLRQFDACDDLMNQPPHRFEIDTGYLFKYGSTLREGFQQLVTKRLEVGPVLHRFFESNVMSSGFSEPIHPVWFKTPASSKYRSRPKGSNPHPMLESVIIERRHSSRVCKF